MATASKNQEFSVARLKICKVGKAGGSDLTHYYQANNFYITRSIAIGLARKS
jgi:hypothetical protein